MAFLIFAFLLAIAGNASARYYISMTIDNHPCQPEKLKNAESYMCDTDGNIRCHRGWKRAVNEDPLYPCSVPVCDPPCENGECRAPNLCACEIGWEGDDCSECITMSGCRHGSCKGKGLGCVCHNSTQWTGGLCDIPVCDGCQNGACVAPGKCQCQSGWTGPKCDTCLPLPGCANGGCASPNGSIPNGCHCDPWWMGPLCDMVDCGGPCKNGECLLTEGSGPICVCNTGWGGANCDSCIPYPGCPNSTIACNNPWECNCKPNVNHEFCGIHTINDEKTDEGNASTEPEPELLSTTAPIPL